MALVGDYISLSSPISVTFWRNFKSGSYPSLSYKDDSVTALAIDWVTSNLYWSSSSRPNIHVTSRNGGYTTSLLQGSLTVKAALIIFLLRRERLHLMFSWVFSVCCDICHLFYKCSRSKFIYSLFLWCKQTSKLLSVKFSHLQVLVHI